MSILNLNPYAPGRYPVLWNLEIHRFQRGMQALMHFHAVIGIYRSIKKHGELVFGMAGRLRDGRGAASRMELALSSSMSRSN